MDCEEAVYNLKKLFSQTPILAYVDYKNSLTLHTHTCGLRLGAILYQTPEDGTGQLITYTSQTLSKSERRNPAHKLEFLPPKSAVADQFYEYLYGETFNVYTDNNLLTYVLTIANLEATGKQWVASLANYHFHLHYMPGKINVDAATLSRIPWDRTLDCEAFKSIIDMMQVSHMHMFEAYIENAVQLQALGLEPHPTKITLEDCQREQELDPAISKLHELCKQRK